jgi:surface carbohydrate biosynthesis protein
MRIALIVDNPTRDLDGLVLVARDLAIKSHQVFLIPMYSARYEIPLLACDFVLFNYARSGNAELIKTLHDAGIKIGILDTEGGIWESPEQFVKSVAHQEAKNYVDQYYLWGSVQHEAFLRLTGFDPGILKVTGCPRYDLCVAPWRDSIRNLAEYQNIILIISNFSLSSPRFSNPETEIKNMVAAGYDFEYARSRAEDEKLTRLRLTEVIRQSAANFPERTFVIRTHPFEDDRFYRQSFQEFKNVQVVREGPVSMWLKKASLALHINSSVGVDAAFMGVPLYSADWISTSIAQGMSDLPLLLSHRLHSLQEFHMAIAQPAPQPTTGTQKKALEEWFHLADGNAHVRVSRAISEFLQKQVPVPLNQAKRSGLFFAGSAKRAGLVSAVDSIGRVIFGARTYRWWRNRILTRNFFQQTKSDKFFTAEEVNASLNRINKIRPSDVTASNAEAAAYNYSRAVGDSVLISLKDFKKP